MANLTVLKFDRAQYFNVESPRGEPEIDPISFSWLGFKDYMRGRQVVTRTVVDDEIGNLPLISHKVYGTTSLWWVIALMSDITDPFLEVKTGRELTIPPLRDIEGYLQIISRSQRPTSIGVPVPRV